MTRAEVLPASADSSDPAIIRAAALLRAGETVAFPTETVYGLGANALDESAVAKIFLAKGRPSHNPLIVHVADAAAARELVIEWTPAAERLAAAFWPGPLSMVLRKQPRMPALVTAGLDTVALRVPAHPIALALLRATGLPIAAPSANRSEAVSPTSAGHVADSLGDRIPLILDGGSTEVGIESTVIDLSGEVPRLLRPGMVGAAEIEKILGASLATGVTLTGNAPRGSPGQLERHYAPRAPVQLYDVRATDTPTTSGAIVLHPGSSGGGREIQLPNDPAGYARGLYAALHTLDAAAVTHILIERPPLVPSWDAIHDRLRRASHT
jgi:L-threonylcarbamoyladenylate synthase